MIRDLLPNQISDLRDAYDLAYRYAEEVDSDMDVAVDPDDLRLLTESIIFMWNVMNQLGMFNGNR